MILVEIIGFLGADPEERFTDREHKRVVTLRVATKVRYGGGQEETIWWGVNIWDDRFNKMLPFLKKGSSVFIVGKMTRAPKAYTATRDGSTQISMTLNAEVIEFTPSNRQDRPGDRPGQVGGGDQSFASRGTSQSMPDYAEPSYATASQVTRDGEQEGSSFASDDLPF